jgi:spore coat polysaccharide biosynthesis predicted glycosyltransferase SpsG
VLLVAAKHSQLGRWFAALVAATAGVPGIVVLVKPHPAESAAPYEREAAGTSHVRVAPATSDLARLTAVTRVLVTANSTAAIEAMAIDVPALVVGLPTNLSPFVEAGAMAGIAEPAGLAELVDRIVRDEQAREALATGRRAFLERYGMVPAAGSAERAAEVVATLAAADPPRHVHTL